MRRGPSWLIILGFLGGCVVFQRPLELPAGDGPALMVLSCRLPGPLRKIARHAYLAVREQGSWTVWECCGPGSHGTRDPFTPSFGDEVRLHGVVTGERVPAMAACIARETEKYGDPMYFPWPGPNSNTYVDAMLRACNIHVDLPSTAVGKDHRGGLGLSWTSGGTGIQLETPVIGLELGLTEGIRVHILSLEFGIDLWPPAIIIPVGEGRIGFGDR